jgi:hypothetical protein
VTLQKPAVATTPALTVTWLVLPGRCAGLPPVRATAADRCGGGAAVVDCLARLPGRVPDGHRVHNVGVRPQPDDGGSPWLDDLPRPGHRDPPRLAPARRGAAAACHRGWDRGDQRRGHRALGAIVVSNGPAGVATGRRGLRGDRALASARLDQPAVVSPPEPATRGRASRRRARRSTRP